jgi:calcineurin-like phosphoesterase family protein
MRTRRFAAVALAALVAASCDRGKQTETPPPAAPATSPATPSQPVTNPKIELPNRPGSVKFAAIGDSGRGDKWQYEVSAQMQAFRHDFKFDFVVMLGDNIYDGWTPDDYRRKFELPYKPLLDDHVTFHATIGNHDDASQPSYAPFNMGGQRYYTFKPPSLVARLIGANVTFFMIDTERLDRTQLAWIDREMGSSTADWKIPVFHRPIYTSGRYAFPAVRLRGALEPLFIRHGVKVAFSGHEHFYEHIKPQNGITYFISGGAGSLRMGDIHKTELTAKGFDRDYHFMLVEISGDDLYFQTVSRTGATIDSGVVHRK